MILKLNIRIDRLCSKFLLIIFMLSCQEKGDQESSNLNVFNNCQKKIVAELSVSDSANSFEVSIPQHWDLQLVNNVDFNGIIGADTVLLKSENKLVVLSINHLKLESGLEQFVQMQRSYFQSSEKEKILEEESVNENYKVIINSSYDEYMNPIINLNIYEYFPPNYLLYTMLTIDSTSNYHEKFCYYSPIFNSIKRRDNENFNKNYAVFTKTTKENK